MTVRGRDQNFKAVAGTGEKEEKWSVKKDWAKKGLRRLIRAGRAVYYEDWFR